MTPKQRFENKVNAMRLEHIASAFAHQIDGRAWPGLTHRMVQLLLAEHRRTLALVRKRRRTLQQIITKTPMDMVCREGAIQACDDILKALAGQKEAR